ncbi:DUF397 domain-containing protein [Saccharopolyspora endophytica]|uniref:DUF397 domain-containing protein n=1 Tax=Saccharopolyspora endophytica TaxID=543886 RepID=A0ABS5DLG7_9PSEU|nr:DUF397 domain-containing protein [Saccharopolyspora endophytica]MBQ0927122.1 DUF397 domain-containing protein [Saccharopolyspora endophytica]
MIEGRVLSDATWFKSSYSATQDACVEVAITSTAIGVRDTKDRDGGTLVFDNATWSTFLTHLRTPKS